MALNYVIRQEKESNKPRVGFFFFFAVADIICVVKQLCREADDEIVCLF